MTTPTIRVYLVDDHAMIRAAVRSLLARATNIDVVGDEGDARQAIARVAELKPDVVLLDITMPGLSGIDAIVPIRESSPRTKIVMLTHHQGQNFVEQALRAGAEGYLSKDSDENELALAVRTVHAGNPYVSPKVTRALLDCVRHNTDGSASSGLSQLTAREREVFQLLALGNSNKQVATALSISVGTARKHRENLQRKLDCHSPAELARLAIREGLMST